MKKGFFIFVFVMLFVSVKLYSQDTQHPIDKYLDSCFKINDYTTMGMVNCTEEAIQMWDDELNKYYKLLMNILDDESVKTLKASELQWIEFKDKEMKNIEKIYSKMEGTMYIPMKYYAKMEVIKTRALQISDFYNLLTEYK
ncbi:MAG: lysozyme inhibitor LprI family protein [Ignavibacteria bacterium]|jgi:uncharacterized protein YecT (DUF1311 family)